MLLVHAPLDTSFPMGLATSFQQHALSEAGIQMIIGTSTEAGLLSARRTSLRTAGSRIAEVVLVIDGVEHRITAIPTARSCASRRRASRRPARRRPSAASGPSCRTAVVPWRRAGRRGRLRAGADRDPAHRTDARRDAGARVRGLAVEGVAMGDFGVELAAPACRHPLRRGQRCRGHHRCASRRQRVHRWRDGTGAELGIVSRPLFHGEESPCGPA